MSISTIKEVWPEPSWLVEVLSGNIPSVELLIRLKNVLDSIEIDTKRIFSSDIEKIFFLESQKLISSETKINLQIFLSNTNDPNKLDNHVFKNYVDLFLKLMSVCLEEEIPYNLKEFETTNEVNTHVKEKIENLENERGYLIHLDSAWLEFSLDRFPGFKGQFNITLIPSRILDIIKKSSAILQFPIPAYFHNLRQQDDQWKFDTLTVYPDFLIDVTSVAACYSPGKSSAIRHLINLFKFSPASKHILIGNAVNEFLDELIIHSDAKFEPLLAHVFRKYPFAISLLGEAEVRDFIDQATLHFQNLKALTDSNFEGLIGPDEACQLEPSFYSVIYGMQGRLDVLVESKNTHRIIELKSGRPYMENEYGINPAHEAQTQLYKLLIKSTKGESVQSDCYLLYSSQTDRPIRHSPHNEQLIQKLLEVRNSIVLLHLHMAMCSPELASIFDLIKPDHFIELDHFVKRDGLSFLQTYADLDLLEKMYFKYFSHFVAREQLISKTGMSGTNNGNGLAGLWLSSSEEKQDSFLIFQHLTISNIAFHDLDSPIVTLLIQDGQNSFNAFRQGDTLILYPEESGNHGALKHQVYKCTLIEKELHQCKVRLRGRQFDQRSYREDQLWCLEQDVLDRSYLHQYENLFEWAAAEKSYRKKMIGKEASSAPDLPWMHPLQLPDDISLLVSKALSAKDYFLIWGPPGSGKTSMVIQSLVENIILHTGENVLLLAYTNRAVDEICESIENLKDEELYDFIRIGSRYGVAEKYHHKLLDHKLRKVENRRELRKMLKQHRIFTATIASMQGKKELFDLFAFDTVIIDEASQILEPNLIGLLYHFKKFILIGDHKQLPAVSSQRFQNTIIEHQGLKELGFISTSYSLFERLYKQCQSNGWLHSYGMLTHQGRMHADIMKLPSKLFYEGRLSLMSEIGRQTSSLKLEFQNHSNEIGKYPFFTQMYIHPD